TYRLFIEKVDPITRKKLSNPNDYSSLIMNPRDNQQNIGKSYIEKVLGSLSERDRLRFEKGQFLSDVDGALWNQDLIIQAQAKEKCEEKVTVVAIDPAVTNKENSDLTGIIVCSGNGREGNIIADYSTKASPDTWAQIVVNAYDKHCANYVVAETNQGGDLVEAIIKNKRSNIMVRKVHASKGKFSRAEPVLALYEQGKVSHFDGLGELEQELTEYVPMKSDKSPDRLDAMVWGMTELVLNYKEQRVLVL
ncbi:DNA-packaging protein, partial [Fangia hongkongensis]